MRPDESRAPSPFVTVLAHVGQYFLLRLGPVDGCNSAGISEAPQSILRKVCRVELSGLVPVDIVCLVDPRVVKQRLGQVGIYHLANHATDEQARFLIEVLDVGDLFVPADIWLPLDHGQYAVGVVSRAGDDPRPVWAFDLGRDDDRVVG